MSSIVTFYSYKGGVGRSMALANVAVLLAKRGLKVLAVDWDLEAPGLEKYFGYFEMKERSRGLLRLFMDASRSEAVSYRDYVCTFDCEARYPITFLPSGREVDESYTENLEAFDWERFFRSGGGAFIEGLRNRWREEYDVVLIDSRTGLSDSGGVCTIQLPDIVVAMFTANFQSVFGTRDVMRLAQRARQDLAYDRMPLTILPLPARWGVQEFEETQTWLDRISDAMQEFCADWLPRGSSARSVFETIKVPQVAYFSFGERLAVVEQGTRDPQGMGFVYDRVASFIASDFADVQALLSVNPEPTDRVEDDGYKYDVFVSYDTATADAVLPLVEELRRVWRHHSKKQLRVFIDVQELRLGEPLSNTLTEALLRSKTMVAFITPRYLESTNTMAEFMSFRDRAYVTSKNLVIPVLLAGDEFPYPIKEFPWLDLRRRSLRPRSNTRDFRVELERLASNLERIVKHVPSFDPSWPTPDYSWGRVISESDPAKSSAGVSAVESVSEAAGADVLSVLHRRGSD